MMASSEITVGKGIEAGCSPEESVCTTEGVVVRCLESLDKSGARSDIRYASDVGHDTTYDSDGASDEPDCAAGTDCPYVAYTNDLKNFRGVYKDCYERTGKGHSGSEEPGGGT